MAKLSTHVLDTLHGRPAEGVRVELHSIGPGGTTLIATARTNADGRTDKPLLEGDAVRRGHYRLVFHVGDYFREAGVAGASSWGSAPSATLATASRMA